MSEIVKEYKFPEDRFEALKESQRLSGLSQAEFDCLLKSFSIGFAGWVGFGRPDEMSITFDVSALVLKLTFDFDKGLMDKRVLFRFSLKELGLSNEEPGYDWRNERNEECTRNQRRTQEC
jgi:hypothetical protein